MDGAPVFRGADLYGRDCRRHPVLRQLCVGCLRAPHAFGGRWRRGSRLSGNGCGHGFSRRGGAPAPGIGGGPFPSSCEAFLGRHRLHMSGDSCLPVGRSHRGLGAPKACACWVRGRCGPGWRAGRTLVRWTSRRGLAANPFGREATATCPNRVRRRFLGFGGVNPGGPMATGPAASGSCTQGGAEQMFAGHTWYLILLCRNDIGRPGRRAPGLPGSG